MFSIGLAVPGKEKLDYFQSSGSFRVHLKHYVPRLSPEAKTDKKSRDHLKHLLEGSSVWLLRLAKAITIGRRSKNVEDGREELVYLNIVRLARERHSAVESGSSCRNDSESSRA